MSSPAAVLLGETHPRLPRGRHLDHQVADPVAELLARQGLGFLEHRGVRREVAAHEVAHLGVPAVEDRGERRHVDIGRCGAPIGSGDVRGDGL